MTSPTHWLREAISDSRCHHASTKRIVMLMAGASLSLGTLGLVVAAFIGRDVGGPLVAFATGLSAMAGVGYVGGKKYEQSKETTNAQG